MAATEMTKEIADLNLTYMLLAQKLLRARDVQEMMRLQTEYIQSQMQALNDQAKELGQSASKVAMDSAKPKF